MVAMVALLKKEVPEDVKLPKQAREIHEYLSKNLEVGKKVDQKDLAEALDAHQEDNAILSTTPKQPISRIFAFYRARFVEAELMSYERISVAKPKKAKDDGEGDTAEAPASRRKTKPAEEAAA
jgi:hypothetical protein